MVRTLKVFFWVADVSRMHHNSPAVEGVNVFTPTVRVITSVILKLSGCDRSLSHSTQDFIMDTKYLIYKTLPVIRSVGGISMSWNFLDAS
jgi:hypothetical protein